MPPIDGTEDQTEDTTDVNAGGDDAEATNEDALYGDDADNSDGADAAEDADTSEDNADTDTEADADAEGSDTDEDGGEDDGDEDDETGAPEEYKAWEVPEGFELDEAKNTDFKAWAKEQNYTQAQAQAALDRYAKETTDAAKANEAAWAAVHEEWISTAKADKEIGGDAYDASVAAGAKAIAQFGTPELREALNLTGAGNHPEMIRFCARIGKALENDKFERGEPQVEPEDTVDVLYPDDTTKK